MSKDNQNEINDNNLKEPKIEKEKNKIFSINLLLIDEVNLKLFSGEAILQVLLNGESLNGLNGNSLKGEIIELKYSL